MGKLLRLPAAVEARLPAIREEWLAVGLSTDPADRSRAEDGVRVAYREAGLEPPRIFVWLDSPLRGVLGATMLQVGGQVWGQVLVQVWDQVWGQVRDQVWGQVRDQVWDQVWGQVYRACYGQYDAEWLAFYATFAECGIQGPERLAGLSEVARSAGWFWTLDGAVVLTERPTTLHRDDVGRLHNDAGAALLYPDGWGIWAWHGVRVPADVIEHPEGLTRERILGEENAEIRRAMVERIGWYAWGVMSGRREVQRDDYGVLYEMPGLGVEGADSVMRVVEVVNSTPEPDGSFKRYTLRVPPTVESAREAVAWTFDEAADGYAPSVQT